MVAEEAEVEYMLAEHSPEPQPSSHESVQIHEDLEEDELFDIPEPDHTPVQKMELAVLRERAAVTSLVMRCRTFASIGTLLEEVLLDPRTVELRNHWELTDGDNVKSKFFAPTMLEMDCIEKVIQRIWEDKPISMERLVYTQCILRMKREYLTELTRIWDSIM